MAIVPIDHSFLLDCPDFKLVFDHHQDRDVLRGMFEDLCKAIGPTLGLDHPVTGISWDSSAPDQLMVRVEVPPYSNEQVLLGTFNRDKDGYLTPLVWKPYVPGAPGEE
jgi:hypothetical protein